MNVSSLTLFLKNADVRIFKNPNFGDIIYINLLILELMMLMMIITLLVLDLVPSMKNSMFKFYIASYVTYSLNIDLYKSSPTNVLLIKKAPDALSN